VFLSRLILDPRQGAVRRDLGDCRQMHRTVMSGFPQAEDPARARVSFQVLYRLDVLASAGETHVLVQSKISPDWSTLPEGYLLGPDADRENPACRPLEPLWGRIRAGSVLRFRLRANPTRKIEDRGRGCGRRVQLLREEEQYEWLARKAEPGGFEMPGPGAVRVVSDRTTGGRSAELVFGSVLFEGHLRVLDADKFREALRCGIGPGKAFGHGLLSVSPVGASADEGPPPPAEVP